MQNNIQNVEQNLEKYFFYRLIKVLYFFSLATCIVITLIISYSALPYKTVDYNLSSVVCNDWGNFSLNQVNVTLNDQHTLDDDNSQIAYNYCQSHLTPMITIQEIRASLPQYNKLSDQDLANKVHHQLFSSMPTKVFYQRFGTPNLPVDLLQDAQIEKRKPEVAELQISSKEKALKPVTDPLLIAELNDASYSSKKQVDTLSKTNLSETEKNDPFADLGATPIDDDEHNQALSSNTTSNSRVVFITDNYTLSLYYKTNGDWLTVFLILVIGILGSYLLLHFLKEGLLYIAFGKKFSFPFLNK